MTTNHQYLKKYPISPKSRKLIVGTIHPHDHHSFKVPFYYGNKLSIWKILNEAFKYEIGQEITLDGILEFLNNHKISLSDTIVKCNRKTLKALDKDLIPLVLNKDLVKQIKYANIEQILFTSGFQKNNAFKLFYVDILGLKINQELRREREAILDKNIFGRPIKLTILYSPSGSSNVALSKSRIYLANKHNYLQSSRPVYDFKVDYYREMFAD